MKHTRESGQTLVEYVLLMVMVIGIVAFAIRLLPEQLGRIEGLLTSQYAASYRFGDKDTKGPPDAYEKHMRAEVNGSFRLFKRKVAE